MLNVNSGLWPPMTANSTDADPADMWGLGSVIETQARLWNHMLDANRNLMELYMPWLAAGPSFWTAAFPPLQAAEEAAEEAVTTSAAKGNGIADAMETQARSWNQFIDANRSFWAAFGWPTPIVPASEGNGADNAGDETATPRRTTARKSSRSASRAR